MLAIDQVEVELRPAANIEDTARKAAPQPAATAATPKQTVAISKGEEAKLLARGTRQIAEGAISEARLIFKWLAERGSGAAAFALAQTYDEAVVANSPTSGLTADMREARRWYERAAELENPEAQKRLSELRSRLQAKQLRHRARQVDQDRRPTRQHEIGRAGDQQAHHGNDRHTRREWHVALAIPPAPSLLSAGPAAR